MSNMILGKHEAEWHRQVPITADLQALKEVCWINPDYVPVSQAVSGSPLGTLFYLKKFSRTFYF